MKKPILILQSCSPNAPKWVRECMHTVEDWAHRHGHHYIKVYDELFVYAPNYCRPPFNKVTRSDICRLRMIQSYLATNNYSAAVWVDADFLIWNQFKFRLPEPEACGVICAREAFRHKTYTGLFYNNSVVGLSNMDDVAELIACSERILDECDRITPPRTTVIGTDLFSSSDLPLKRLVVKSAGCLSEHSIDLVIGPRISGHRHLWWLALAHGHTLHGANLCSSREHDNERMEELLDALFSAPDQWIGRWKYISPFYRLWLRASIFPERLRCWGLTRLRHIRLASSGKT